MARADADGQGLLVLDDGKHHAVVAKPAGVTVVKARGVPQKTLLDLAEERFGAGVRPVHRLDKPTTGCCVIAKSEYGQQALSDAFRRHLVDKRYLALVRGTPPWPKLVIDARLHRVDLPDAKKGPLAIQTVDDAGKRALTRVRVLAQGQGVTLVEARPETGRMHQIRAHLAHVGFPLAGDALYGGASDEDEELYLHAWAISFPAPEGGRRFVTAPVPAHMRERLLAAGIDVEPLFERERERFEKKLEPSEPTRRPSNAVLSGAKQKPSKPHERPGEPKKPGAPGTPGKRAKNAARPATGGSSGRPKGARGESQGRPGNAPSRRGSRAARPKGRGGSGR